MPCERAIVAPRPGNGRAAAWPCRHLRARRQFCALFGCGALATAVQYLVLVAGSGLAILAIKDLLMWIGRHGLHIGYLIVPVAATGPVLLFSFTLNRSWVLGRLEEG